MKNFKKVLALVLVLATLLGLATMAGAATEYKDADKINADYTEAIKVLDLIETMQGYPDGNFKPTATITREEAAKVIAIFDNKDADISTYYTSINPFTDEKGRWGESYVGYGYRAGIIAGMNATTYAPTANVTGTQFLKMALVTLGYDQEKEGFVGASWAVNVLALAKKIGLIDGLADGWKPEHDLTREEAAQILLNALNTNTVEYGQEAKLANFKPVKVILKDTYVKDEETGEYKLVADADYSFNGKFYVTVAGAVKTGHPLYEDFDLTKTVSTDAFYRPYTKWTKDKTSVEIKKAPKATFTKEFSACDLLVALGIKETDRDTTIVIDKVYCDGDDTAKFVDHAIFAEGEAVKDKDDNVIGSAWHHEYSTCAAAKGAKHGAQGTLTEVFYNGKDADGNKHYTITSIETWLGKVDKVSAKTTSRDNHLKAEGNVTLFGYFSNLQTLEENNFDYCGEEYDPDKEDTDTSTDGHTAHCEKVVEGMDANKDGSYTLSYSGETGSLKKGDFVLFTYSLRTLKDDGKTEYKDDGVQTLDLTEGKAGRLTGYKFGTSAGSDPSQTRIDSEYVKDSQHFHFGYDKSKSKEYGTYTFYYDAYGNVIGMDGNDSSTWGVIDNAYTTFPKGETTLNAAVVDLDAKTTESTIKKFANIEAYYGEADEDNVHSVDDIVFPDGFDSTDAKNFAYTMAVALKNYTNGEANRDFSPIYDHLFKVTTDKDGVYSVKVATKTVDGIKVAAALAYGVHPFDMDDDTDLTANTIKVVNGKPYLTISDDDNDADTSVTLTSSTRFLVHKMDGTYASFTGFKNVPSMIAHYAEIVFTADKEDKNTAVADIVYLANDVYMTDGKVLAYVGNGADMSNIEVKEDGDPYYNLTVYINGEETNVYVSEEDMLTYFNKGDKAHPGVDATPATFTKGFYELQYTDIEDITTVKALKGPEDSDLETVDQYLDKLYVADYFNGTVIKLSGKDDTADEGKLITYVLADNCGFYGIYKDKVEKIEASEIQDKYDTGVHKVYVALDKDNNVTAIYLNLAAND
ncbi:MAG: S-layer homology domain-containing protein [Oscillospiraceae bacterium]